MITRHLCLVQFQPKGFLYIVYSDTIMLKMPQYAMAYPELWRYPGT